MFAVLDLDLDGSAHSFGSLASVLQIEWVGVICLDRDEIVRADFYEGFEVGSGRRGEFFVVTEGFAGQGGRCDAE